MSSLDAISIGILLGALLLLLGIMSSLIAMRFGAPLLFVFLILGILAGEAGPGGLKFDDVGPAYVVGSIALALILFDGGLRTRFATVRSVLGPAVTLATLGVLLTAALTAPVAYLVFDLRWIEALLVGAVVASTDAAAVFFLMHGRGLRLRPRVGSTLEVESASNDPFAVLLTMLLVEFLTRGDRSWQHVLAALPGSACPLRPPQRARHLRARLGGACLGLSRDLPGRTSRGQPADPRPQHRGRVPRRRYLAGTDRDVRAARFARMAVATHGQCLAGACGGGDADAGRASGCRVLVPCTVSFSLARKGIHRVGWSARGREHLSGLHPVPDRALQGVSLFRYRVCGRARLAADPRLDNSVRGAAAGRCAAAARSAAAAGRA